MLGALVYLTLAQSDALSHVKEVVSKLPGVVIEAESMRSGTRMTFKIAPSGHFFAKYPTTECYYTTSGMTLWMPDRKEFSRDNTPSQNPLPPGFDALWPSANGFKQNGDAKNSRFADKEALEIPCRASDGTDVRLFVDPKTWLPQGSIAVADGKEYELRYLSLTITKFAEGELDFKPAPDAKPSSGGPPDASKLIQPGKRIPHFRGRDANGAAVSLETTMSHFPKGVVVNFWFASCVGCIDEMPYLAKLSKNLASQKVGLIGVNGVDDLATAKRSATRNHLPYPSLVGVNAKQLLMETGVVAHPVTIVVDARGIIVDSYIGFDQKRLEKALGSLGYKL